MEPFHVEENQALCLLFNCHFLDRLKLSFIFLYCVIFFCFISCIVRIFYYCITDISLIKLACSSLTDITFNKKKIYFENPWSNKDGSQESLLGFDGIPFIVKRSNMLSCQHGKLYKYKQVAKLPIQPNQKVWNLQSQFSFRLTSCSVYLLYQSIVTFNSKCHVVIAQHK